MFVVKYDNSGNLIWAKGVGGTGDDGGYGVRVDGNGNVYVAGSFTDTVDFDPGPGVYNRMSAGDVDIFLLKLDNSGDFIWANTMGGTGEDRPWGLTLDYADNSYVTGAFSATADFDAGAGNYNLTSQGGTDIFVAKYNSPGNIVWAKSMGGEADDIGRAIAVDFNDNICATGYFMGTVSFATGGTVNVTSNGGYDIFVWKLNSSGNFLWGAGMGGGGDDYGVDVAYDMSGNIFTTGSFSGTADFDPGEGAFNMTSPGGRDIFASKLDTNGNFVMAKRMGGTENNVGNGISIDGLSGIYITGRFRGTADFDPGSGSVNLTSAGLNDAFVVKLSGPPDTTPPNATSIIPSTTGPTSDTSIQFEVIFDKYVQGFDSVDDLVINTTGSVAVTGAAITGSDYRYTVTISGISGTGTLSLAVSTASDVRDLANNPLATSVTSADVLIDNSPAPNAIAIWPSTVGPTCETTISFKVIFDKPVQNFDDVSDLIISVTGDVNYGSIIFSPGGDTWHTVYINDISGLGTLTLAVSTGSDVEDLLGKPLESSVTSPTVYLDPDAFPLSLALWPSILALLLTAVIMLRIGRKYAF